MPNLLDLPSDILDKINNMVIEDKNKDLLKYFFGEWKSSVMYRSGGFWYIKLYQPD